MKISNLGQERTSKSGNKYGSFQLGDEPGHYTAIGELWEAAKKAHEQNAEVKITEREQQKDKEGNVKENQWLVKVMTVNGETLGGKKQWKGSGGGMKTDPAAMLTGYKKDIYVALVAAGSHPDPATINNIVNAWHIDSKKVTP